MVLVGTQAHGEGHGHHHQDRRQRRLTSLGTAAPDEPETT